MSYRAALLALLGLLLLAAPARAAEPLLVYVVVIDALDGDAVDQGNAPFIASMLRGDDGSNATYWRESRSIMVAETNPNHVAMATGAYGDVSGIPGNNLAVRGATDGNSCPATTSPSTAPEKTTGESPGCLRAETFFHSVAPGVVTAGIFGKPKLARIFAGRTGDRYDADYLWTPCNDPSDSPYCKQVPARPNDNYTLADSEVMDELLRTVREGVPGDGKTFTGRGPRPNLTFVNLPGVDSSGHATGRGSTYDATVGAADGQIQRFVTQQKQLGLWKRTVLVLLSDHSMETASNRSSLTARSTAAGIDPDDYVLQQNGSAALVYVTDASSPGRFALLKRLRTAALGTSAAPLAGPGAAEALYREPNPVDGGSANTIGTWHPAWHLSASDRVGDLMVTAEPGGAFNEPNPLVGNHGGPQTRDNFFAVIGGGPLVKRQALAAAQDPLFDDTERNPGQAENVDVAPTVSWLLAQRAPAQNQGRILAEAFDASQLPGAAGSGPAPCAAPARFRSVSVRPRGRGLRLGFKRRGSGGVRVDVFQSSVGRRIVRRRVAHFTGRRRAFTWRGRRARDGILIVRFQLGKDVRRSVVRRHGGRFHRRPGFSRRASCGPISAFKLERPVFGGRGTRGVHVTYRLGASGRVKLQLLRGRKVVRRLAPTKVRKGGSAHRVRIKAKGLRRGDYRVRLQVRARGKTTVARLTAKRL